jgi:hypothetical protein
LFESALLPRPFVLINSSAVTGDLLGDGIVLGCGQGPSGPVAPVSPLRGVTRSATSALTGHVLARE